jgi:hypothetical protein
MMQELLTQDQIKRILELLAAVIDVGHGEVTIRVVNGRAKFISVTYENRLLEIEKIQDRE